MSFRNNGYSYEVVKNQEQRQEQKQKQKQLNLT